MIKFPRFFEIKKVDGIRRFDSVEDGTATRRGVAYGAGLYVEVGNSGLIRTSPTGNVGTWTVRASGLTTATLFSVKWINRWNMFYATGSGGNLFYSADGINWTQGASPGGLNLDWLDVTENGNRVILVGANAMTAYNTSAPYSGAGWTTSSLPAGTHHTVQRVAWSATNSLFVCATEANPTCGIFSSPDGVTWTTRQSGIPNGIYGVATSGSNIIFVGYSGSAPIIYRSTNGTTYTAVTQITGATTALRTAFYFGGALYALGFTGAAIVSPDNGVSWSAAPTTGITKNIRFGMPDPNDSRRCIIVGETGASLRGQLFFRVSAFGSTAARSTIPLSNGWWRFNPTDISGATVLDRSGLGNNGTLIASPTFSAGPGGGALIGMNLNGTTQYMDCGDVLNVGANNFSMCAWFKSTDTRGGNANGIIWKCGTSGVNDVGYGVSLQNGLVRAYIGDGTTIRTLTSPDGVLYNDGSWHHVVVTVDRTEPSIRIYVDGAQVQLSSTLMPTGGMTGTQPLQIGFTPGTGGAFNGSIAQPRVYQGVVLDASTIAAMYASESAGKPYAPLGSFTTAYSDLPARIQIPIS